ncbi:MAG: hypothetical protein RIB01_15325 [Balneola sp.]
MKKELLYFIPLLTLERVNDYSPECEWAKIEFMDLNFDKGGESIAVCDGDAFYIKNETVRCLFDHTRDGHYKISTIGYSSV